MSSSAVLIKPVPISVTIESGPLQGKSYAFQRDRISIGRDSDNDLVVPDDQAMSRKHAELVFVTGVLWVRNLSDKNPLWVDGNETKDHVVERKLKFQVGETTFTVRIQKELATQAVMASKVQPPVTRLKVAPLAQAVPNVGPAPRSAPRPNPRPVDSSDGKKMNFYIVVGIVGLGLIWLFMSGSNASRKASQLRSRDNVLMDLEKSESAIRDIEKKQEETGQQTLQYKTSQEHYIKGFRDYRQGQYARAMSSFQASLSFYPQHELARKYLTLSRRKFDELIQFNMIQGKRYKGKNNYRLCKSAYANVMIMLKDPNEQIYREAKQYYNECSLLFEGKY